MQEGKNSLQYFTVNGPDGTHLTIRDIASSDLSEVTEIYNHYVLHTVITFDVSPFEPSDRIGWFNQFAPNSPHQCLVVTLNEKVVGYASSSRFRPKSAYDQSVESTIYLHPQVGGRGLGKKLYGQLFKNLKQQLIHRLIAIIALPNARSIRLHEQFGFTTVGKLSEVGYKFGQYHDTLLLEKVVQSVK